jgi:hypothetical protein
MGYKKTKYSIYGILDHRRDGLLEKLNTDPVEKKWSNHANRMEDIRYPKQVLDYRPIGIKPECPLKRQS